MVDAGVRRGLLRKLLISLLIIVCYRLGTYVPLPGVDIEAIQSMVERASGGFLGIFNVFSGGALGRMTIFALSVMPYIVASIVMQLFSVAFKSLGDLKNEGEYGRKKINFYSRLMTLFFCVLQGGVIVISLERADYGGGLSVVYDPGFQFRLMALTSLIGGTMLLLWLGDQISNYGIGNGISLIIFSGIVAEFPSSIAQVVSASGSGFEGLVLIAVLALCTLLFFFIVLFERSYRKVGVFYPRRQMGNRVYGGSNSHIPIKINISGVMPVIFANSLILFPVTIADFNKGAAWANFVLSCLAPGSLVYILVYVFLIMFFCFFYSGFVFSCEDIASSLKKNGGFIPGKRPGISTAKYLEYLVFRLTFIGGIYLALVCAIPELLRSYYSVPFTLGGASFLIMVSVVVEIFVQIQSQIFSGQYSSLIGKVGLCRPGQK